MKNNKYCNQNNYLGVVLENITIKRLEPLMNEI
jgi:hypothetical protein